MHANVFIKQNGLSDMVFSPCLIWVESSCVEKFS